MKDTKPEEQDIHNEDHPFELVYNSNYRRTVYGVKLLSFTGCVASLIVAPLIIFNPLNFALLAPISTIGKCFLGIPVAMFGVGTSYALHMFTRAIVTQMYHNVKTDDIQLQSVTIYLKTITRNTNLKHMSAMDKSTHIGLANVFCSDINKQCFINPEYLSEYVANKIGFNDETLHTNVGDEDTSWMGKQ